MTLSRFAFFALVFFTSISISWPAFAQVQGPLTVLQLQQLCDSRYDVEAGMCAGYIKAVAEAMTQDSNPMHRLCLNPAIGPQILMENVRRDWASLAPEEQYKPQDLAMDAVKGALRRRFRCM